MENAIEVRNIHKNFGDLKALNGVSLSVPKGTVLGLLGPNGAGKTTLVRIMTTLLQPDNGEVVVGGFNVVTQSDETRRVIGLAGQYAAVDENLTGLENLELVGSLYHIPRQEVFKKAWNLLERFDLADAANRVLKTYSGGMRRRLDLAASLINDPEILFLDEPTTGLDPQSRAELWEIIKELVAKGTTLLLTTQYMEEADYLADNIEVIDHGQVIASGTPDELKAQMGGDVLEVHVSNKNDVESAREALARLGDGESDVDRLTGKITVPIKNGAKVMPEAVRILDSLNIPLNDINLRRPTLDEVFLKLTGHKAE